MKKYTIELEDDIAELIELSVQLLPEGYSPERFVAEILSVHVLRVATGLSKLTKQALARKESPFEDLGGGLIGERIDSEDEDGY